MDLNEKIAARRRELAIEEQAAINADKERAREENERTRKESEREIIEEIVRRSERGVGISAPSETSKVMTDSQYNSALTKGADDRMTTIENTLFVSLTILGIVSLFIAWPIGVILIIWAGVYYNEKLKKYKAKIITEGEVRAK